VIGSTARNLARTTVVPAVVDRIERGVDDPDPIRRHLFKRTLFATDFSENAERAFQAFEYLRHATEEVTLVHVESPKDDAGGEADPDERLADLADRLGDWGSTLAPRCGAAIPPRRSSLLRRSTTRVPCSSALAGAAGSDGCWGASPRRSLPARPGTSFSCRRARRKSGSLASAIGGGGGDGGGGDDGERGHVLFGAADGNDRPRSPSLAGCRKIVLSTHKPFTGTCRTLG